MPKTIAILAPSSVPFQVGGAEKLWWSMRSALGALPDCWCELIKLPSPESNFREIVNSCQKFANLDLSHFDLLISTKYPAWMAAHPNHVCYMQHTLRCLYDTYHLTGLPERLPWIPRPLRDLMAIIRDPEAGRDSLGDAFSLCRRAFASKSLPDAIFAFPGPLIREIVHYFDRVALAPGQIKSWLAISANVAGRKDYFPPGAPVTVLHHPTDIADFACLPGEYFFTASRLNSLKRVDMLIDAMRHVKGDIPLLVAGIGPELGNLRSRAAAIPKSGRIKFLGHVADAELPGLYAKAIAVIFAPYDEDYGLITLEAFKSGKPVITATDSGGPLEFVLHGQTGLVAEPNAAALGQAMNILAENRALAEEMGQKARESVKNIDWAHVAKELLGCATPRALPKIIVVSAFPANREGYGAQRRLFHLCKELGKAFLVEVVCFAEKMNGCGGRAGLTRGAAQTTLPWPAELLAHAEKLAAETGASCDNLAILQKAHTLPHIVAAIKRAGAGASCAIASQPWLYPALAAALPDLPIIYDAHNVEADLQKYILGHCPLAATAQEAEGRLAQKAALVFACSKAGRQRLAGLYNIDPDKILLLPNGCDSRATSRPKGELRGKLPYQGATLVIFLGSGHKPNMDACLAIFQMAEALPDVQFLIGGAVSTQKIIVDAKRPANAHLLGEISEKVKNLLLEAADVALNPVVSGSGVNLKIVEYLSFGIPTISTPSGMRGMPDNLGPAAMIAELADFPQAIGQMLANRPGPEELDKIARSVTGRFAWGGALAALCPAITSILEKKSCG